MSCPKQQRDQRHFRQRARQARLPGAGQTRVEQGQPAEGAAWIRPQHRGATLRRMRRTQAQKATILESGKACLLSGTQARMKRRKRQCLKAAKSIVYWQEICPLLRTTSILHLTDSTKKVENTCQNSDFPREEQTEGN